MNILSRFAIVLVLIFAFLSNASPCGPGYITPIFEINKSPEQPYKNFAAGNLGIIKPTFRRSVLIAAYRYLGGGSFSVDEQNSLVDLWKTTIDRDYTQTDEVTPVVKLWLDKRKEVVTKEEKIPSIYVERSYGGYDFFPNCSINAFEVAAETLGDRIASHGPNDAGVQNWVRAQDEVFQNCASGKRIPEDVPVGSPEWLEKDRGYQQAAAEFYSLDFRNAKQHFAEIAQDTASPWQETADYLVARTLIRQASLSSSPIAAKPLYEEAESHLQRFISRTGKFSDSSERMIGLVRFRLYPKERVGELARKISFQTANNNFKQDIIDYTWLLDKFESETLEAEAMRKAAIENAKNPNAEKTPEPTPESPAQIDDNELVFTVYTENYVKNWVIRVPVDASDQATLAAAEKIIGNDLTDDIAKRVIIARQEAYSNRFSDRQQSIYEGGYYSEDKLELKSLPAFLKNDDLTDWLFTIQTETPEAYSYSLKKYIATGADHWLISAIVKADKSSPDLQRLLEASDRLSSLSPAYETVVYHRARLLLDLGKNAEGLKIVDEMLARGDGLSITSQNSFAALKLRLAESLDNFLAYSLRRPFAYDFDGSVGSIDDLIALQKTYYDPEYNKDGREAFEREVEERFKTEKLWIGRKMFASETIDMMNRTFPQSLLSKIERSPAIPDYLRPKFAIAIWTRAYLLDDMATLIKMTPAVAQYDESMDADLAKITSSTSQVAMDRAVLYFILKNPVMSPWVEDGMGKADNQFGEWDSNDWWCSYYISEDSESPDIPKLKIPGFVTAAQKQAAEAELRKLSLIGDAPEFLAKRVIDWQKRAPLDKRVPEALYIVHAANGWTKYGCGNSEETQVAVEAILRKSYPNSEWTRKLDADKAERDAQ
ncbi:MAG: hypothetical protein IPI76_01705 [Chloracidobacterium sp.]|nr:hypothetical protein [Chloracidobacterium sp.]MBP9934468.1 hypothetical protein [Pyrinomonadaceae bacterium]